METLVAAAILAGLVVASLQLFGNLGRSQQNTLNQNVADTLAIDLMREIKVLAYADPELGNGTGLEAGETGPDRLKYDDVDDYNGWSACPPQQKDGRICVQGVNLTQKVAVNYVAAADFNQVVSCAQDEGFKKITITICQGNQVVTQQQYIIANAPWTMMSSY